MPVSIKDIAKEAGVSPSTVSRALRDHPRINRDTKANIQNLATAMGYVPSAVARDLVARQTATIGIVIGRLSDPFYDRLMLGLEDGAVSAGYRVLLSSFNRDAKREAEIVHDFSERRVDGIIVAGAETIEAYISPERKFMPPSVLINRPGYPYSVSSDSFEGARRVIKHMIELGHRRIAYVTWGSEHPDGMPRLSGYQATLNEYGIAMDDDLIVHGDGQITGGIKAVPRLLGLSSPPSAIFCFNDMTAIGVINALRQKGCEVPRDVSVAGFDDLEMAAYYHPSLTTVRQPTYRIGRHAVNMLLRLVREEGDVVPKILEPEFVARESTAPIAI